MVVSLIDIQRDVLLRVLKRSSEDWKVLIVDEASKALIDNVLSKDQILDQDITHIEQIEHKRTGDKSTDGLYILSPLPHIVDCLMADFERRRYKRALIAWIGVLDPQSRRRLHNSQMAQEQIGMFQVLSIDFCPKESHVATFVDPYSFPILYHPNCNNLVKEHMQSLAQKIAGICISLDEYPKIRYYRPRDPWYEPAVLCSHLARFVQEEIDSYARANPDFQTPKRSPAALLIIDRSMDLYSPLVHEFTYQAMAQDLLGIQEARKTTYKVVLNQGQPDEEEKEMEIGENDKIWVENRHRHMQDTIQKLMGDFRKFMDENPHFTQTDAKNATSLNAIKDMLAGLPEFKTLKEAYSLHLSMAQECMNLFQERKLVELAPIEQSIATGYDEQLRKPRNVADQVVRLLDDDAITPRDRLRLLLLYILYRDGLLRSDIEMLLAHAQLPPTDGEVIDNLVHLGLRVHRSLKDPRPVPPPVFAKPAPTSYSEEYGLSRYDPGLKTMLEEHIRGTLDQSLFPFTRPDLDRADSAASIDQSAASLRAKPTWAKTRWNSSEPRQRIIVFVAGGATYSEARSCYEISQQTSREVFLITSHLLTPFFFIRQVKDLSADRRRLNIPADRPKPRAPAHLFEITRVPGLADQNAAPVDAMAGLRLGPGAGTSVNKYAEPVPPKIPSNLPPSGGDKVKKDKDKFKDEKEKKDKKKHHFFSSKKF